MAKKFSLLLAAVAVVALAVPAFASAAAVTDGSGNLLGKGTKISGTSTNATTLTSLGLLTCATVKVNGELTANSGGTVEGVGVGAGETSTCRLGKKEISITDITLTSLKSTGTSHTGTIGVTFEADLPELHCHFKSPAAGLPFSYSAGGNTLTISEGNLEGTPEACEPGTLNGTFTISQTGGGAVVLD